MEKFWKLPHYYQKKNLLSPQMDLNETRLKDAIQGKNKLIKE